MASFFFFSLAHAVFSPSLIASLFVSLFTGALLHLACIRRSVWAHVLGLVSPAAAAGLDLVSTIRESTFVGASGPIAMDNVTGDRLTGALQLRLQVEGLAGVGRQTGAGMTGKVSTDGQSRG